MGKFTEGESTEITPERQAALKGLAPELFSYAYIDKLGGIAVEHPLVSEHRLFSAESINKRLELMKAQLAEALGAGNWYRAVFTYERGYRLTGLLRCIRHRGLRASPAAYWPLVAAVWADSESTGRNLATWRDLWGIGRWPKVPHRRKHVMNDEERAALAALPPLVPIYRGIGHRRAALGLSWTIDRERAEWFARRFAGVAGRRPFLVSGKIERRHMLAYLGERKESEIVVDPDKVRERVISEMAPKLR
jgi:hypothetical protein